MSYTVLATIPQVNYTHYATSSYSYSTSAGNYSVPYSPSHSTSTYSESHYGHPSHSSPRGYEYAYPQSSPAVHYAPYPSSLKTKRKVTSHRGSKYDNPPSQDVKFQYSADATSVSSHKTKLSSRSRNEGSGLSKADKDSLKKDSAASLPLSDEKCLMRSIKIQLRKMLKLGKLSNCPLGFPFHSSATYEPSVSSKKSVSSSKSTSQSCRYGSAAGSVKVDLSHDSYEFMETFSLPDQPWIEYRAIFKYSAPDMNSPAMSWKIYLPPITDGGVQGPLLTSQLIAHVQVSPRVLESPVGLEILTEPYVIADALATSMESGVVITVQMVHPKDDLSGAVDVNGRPLQHKPGKIGVALLTTNNAGKTGVLKII